MQGTYFIISADKQNLAIDHDSNHGAQPDHQLQMETVRSDAEGYTQKWRIEPDPSRPGYHVIRWESGGGDHVMYVQDNSLELRKEVRWGRRNGNASQSWAIEADGQYYRIRNNHSQKVLDRRTEDQGNGGVGGHVQQYDDNGQLSHRWILRPAG